MQKRAPFSRVNRLPHRSQKDNPAMPASNKDEQPSSGSVRLARRIIGVILDGFGVLLVLLLLVIILQLTVMLQAARQANAPSKISLCRKGNTLTTCHSAMPRQSFSAVKETGVLRIFIVGSSQAMGSPYVHQEFNHISSFFPNEGGLATWLEDYLSFAMPKRHIEIINVAKANGSKTASNLDILREILAKGSPDIIVIMDGNNERVDNGHIRVNNSAQRDAVATVIYPAYQLTIQTMAREATTAGVRTIFVTLPSNLRDWPPETRSDRELFERLFRDITTEPYDGGRKHRPVLEAACRDLRSQWPQIQGNSAAHFSLARCLEYEGKIEQARSEYIAARDLDYCFVRVRSVQNEFIRALRGPGVSVVDLEALMRGYAYDGIPGNDLFHDYCHMNLRGNKISGFEIARKVLQLEGVPMHDEELRQAPLRHINHRGLWWLYWYQTVKWTLYRFLPSSWQQLGLRGRPIADGFCQAMREIDKVEWPINLLRKNGENGAQPEGAK
jgi:hypothetical protein